MKLWNYETDNAKRHLVLSFIVTNSIVFGSRLYADDLAENQSRFGKITGDVGLLTQGASDWIEPHEGLPIETGDEIRTGEDGQVEIIVSQNALWLLEPHSDVVAEHVTMNSGRLDMAAGILMGKVDSQSAAEPQHWEFSTPAAEVAARGTEFALVVSKTRSQMGVFEGEAEMAPAETAAGEVLPERISSRHEAILERGKTLKVQKQFGPEMQLPLKDLPQLLRALMRNENTWSPFTNILRTELRKKFVAPVTPHHNVPRPRRRPTPSTSETNDAAS